MLAVCSPSVPPSTRYARLPIRWETNLRIALPMNTNLRLHTTAVYFEAQGPLEAWDLM